MTINRLDESLVADTLLEEPEVQYTDQVSRETPRDLHVVSAKNPDWWALLTVYPALPTLPPPNFEVAEQISKKLS